MAVRKVVKYPQQEAILRKHSKPVTKIDREITKLIQDLKDTVLVHPAVGLAAPQIGANSQIFVVRFGQKKDSLEELTDPIAIINPKIISEGELVRDYDACVSIPGLYGYTYRPSSLEIEGLDESGSPIHMVLTDLDARVVHHEIDHLRGTLFLDIIRDRDKDLFIIATDENGETVLIPFSEITQRKRPEFRI